MGPLAGLKVLDLSRILAGPWATQCLADYGAEVWKIERPGEGDDTRKWGPPWLSLPDGTASAESAYYLSCNRGKHSLAIDLAHPEGQALIRQLALQADVLVENFKLDGLKKYGLDHASLTAAAPRLIYCSITGFGHTGPRREQAGYDAMIQAQGGIMSITGEADDLPGAGPQKIGVAAADLMCGMYAVSAILAALHARERSGQGQVIDLALFDTQLAWLANQAMNYLVGGTVPQRLGTAHPNIVPYQVFAVRDGHMMLAVGNDRQFRDFCAVAGQPELAQDARFATNQARVRHRAELLPLLAHSLQQDSLDTWLARLAQAQVPCGPINTIDRAFADPQSIARDVRFELPHALGVEVPQVRNPVRFSGTPVCYDRAPPLLGADTSEVLTRVLGVSADELADLRAARAIG